MKLCDLSALGLSLLFACTAAAPTAAPEDTEPAKGAPEEARSCAELTEKACLDSAPCTLAPDDAAQGGYRCREAEPPCESDFKQGTDTAAQCTAKAGCIFDPGQCYCAPDVVCICGGGPPPRCIAADSQESAPVSR